MLVHFADISMHRPIIKLAMLNDVSGSTTFSMASPDPFTSVTCAQCEYALICEEHRTPVVDLPILVFCGKCQSSSSVPGSEHTAH